MEWNDQGLVSMQLGDVKFSWSLNSMKTKTIFHASKQQYFLNEKKQMTFILFQFNFFISPIFCIKEVDLQIQNHKDSWKYVP